MKKLLQVLKIYLKTPIYLTSPYLLIFIKLIGFKTSIYLY